MVDLHFTIHGNPTTKKNSMSVASVRTKTGKTRFIPIQSKVYAEYRKTAAKQIPHLDKPIDTPVVVKAVFYRERRGVVDRPNLEAALHDLLVEFGVLADDNRDIVASGDGTRVYYDKENPRTEVWITDFTEEYEQWKDLRSANTRKRKSAR